MEEGDYMIAIYYIFMFLLGFSPKVGNESV